MGSNTDTAELRRTLQEARRPLGQLIYQILRRQILRGGLPPGERLVEEKLARSLGASRTPVREALQRLAQERLLVKLPRGGYEVRGFTLKEIEEIFGIRSVLETYAASLATRRISQGELRELEEIIAQSQAAVDRQDVEEFIELNTRFHDRLYQASGNDHLYRMIHDLRDYFYRYRAIILRVPGMPKISLKDHQEMIQAMRRGEVSTVERRVREHILRGREVVLEQIQKGGLPIRSVEDQSPKGERRGSPREHGEP
jgi:DNA-binding GntR family transcriptional regulator